MAFRLTDKQRRQIEALAASYESVVRDAFIQVAQEITSQADFDMLVKAIEQRDINGVLRAIGLQDGSFNTLGAALDGVYSSGGALAMSMVPLVRDANGYKVNFQFNARNTRAERRLGKYLRGLIQDFTKEQERVVRDVLKDGLAAGRNPRQVAQSLIGVFDPATRKRAGGMLTLNRNQSAYVRNARAELASGLPDDLAKYLTRTRRDKRFDSVVKRAMLSGEPLTEAQINKLSRRYADRLLITRANTIGQTETMEVLIVARFEAAYQSAEQADLDPDKAEKVWIATRDNRTRDQHAQMNNVTVVGLETPFTMPDGSKMMHPCDTSLGAGASQTINCRCTYFVRFNYFARREA